MQWLNHAPANIALIKYMGKQATTGNVPTNTSISYTLDHLVTHVALELSNKSEDTWLPFDENPLQLSIVSQQRFLAHLARIKKHYDYAGNFIVRSGNNFPADCGIASSASSFAALTRTAVDALSELTHQPRLDTTAQAQLSQQGSGSSCRSFFTPWAIWTPETVSTMELPYPALLHKIIVVDAKQKQVSSSAAHQRISSSLLFQQRPQNANQRAELLLQQLQQQQWSKAFITVWQDFCEMHALFETANPPFGYLTPATHEVLEFLRAYWDKTGDGPLVTIDAGPNVHLLFRLDQQAMLELITHELSQKYQII